MESRTKRAGARDGAPTRATDNMHWHVIQLLSVRHGVDELGLRRLDARGRRQLRHIALMPSRLDHRYRKQAITALGILGGGKSVAALAAIASDARAEETIVCRALLALARCGGMVAAYVIEGASWSERVSVRRCSWKAAVLSGEGVLAGVIAEAAREHPDPSVRLRAREWLKGTLKDDAVQAWITELEQRESTLEPDAIDLVSAEEWAAKTP